MNMNKDRANEIIDNVNENKVADGFMNLLKNDIEGNEEKIGACKDFFHATDSLGFGAGEKIN